MRFRSPETNTAPQNEYEPQPKSHRAENGFSRFKREKLAKGAFAISVGAVAIKMALGLQSTPVEKPPVVEVKALPAAVAESHTTPPVFVPTERPHLDYQPQHAPGPDGLSYADVAPLAGPPPMEGPQLPSMAEQTRIVHKNPFIKV